MTLRTHRYIGQARYRRTLLGHAVLGTNRLTKRVVLVGCAFCLVLGIGRFW